MHTKLPKPDTVMLVDDSSFDRKIVERTIGFTKSFKSVLIFSSGSDALDYITDNINNPAKLPQLILLDIQMPEMDGFEFINRFALLPESFRKTIKAALLSSTDDLGDIAKADANPHIIKLIKKPLHPAVFLELLKEHYQMEE